MKRLFYVVIGIAAALLIVFLFIRWYRGPVVEVLAERVTRQTVRDYVDERGMTRVTERFEITMPYDGRVERIDLQEGDRVSAGQPVVRLHPADVRLDVEAAQAVVRRLEASLAENRDIALEMTAKEQTELMAAAAKAMADAAQFQRTAIDAWARYWATYVERIQPLTQRFAESEDELARAMANREATEAELQQRELNATSQSLMYRAIEMVPQMILDYLNRKKLQGDVIARQLDEAQIQVEEALLRQQRAVMTSPIDGVVLDRPVFEEQFHRAGTVLLILGRLQDLEVEADVLTQQAAAIRARDEVEVYGPAVGAALGKGIRGSVRRVSPDAFTKVSSLGVEEQRVTVIISLDQPAELLEQRPGLGVGFRVRARIFTNQRENAIAVPRAALFRGENGDWHVFVVRGGRAVAQAIEIGLANDQRAEVTRGLNEGELVIVAPESNLVAGMRVKVQTP